MPVARGSNASLARSTGSYADLRRRAADYAGAHLAGRTIANQATQLAITLTPEALAAATREGTPAALLQAIPDLLSLLAGARYVRSSSDRRGRAGQRSVNLLDTRRLHLLTATARIRGHPVELLFAIRENFGGQAFLDRVTMPDTRARHRGNGGGLPDDTDKCRPQAATTLPIRRRRTTIQSTSRRIPQRRAAIPRRTISSMPIWMMPRRLRRNSA